MERIVIVGAGQGGFQAAASLRQNGFQGELLVIGDESVAPYQRPPLSKAYLKTGDATALALRPDSFYEAQNITLRLGTRVDGIDRAAQRLRIGAETIPYDHLILATGTRNARPPISGLERCRDLRSLADAQDLREALATAGRVGVIGGGFIGLEFAAVARAQGHDVVVAEAACRLMARAISPQMSSRFLGKHRELGTDIRLNAQVAEVTDTGFTLANDDRVACDFTLLAAGVVPNTELAADAGLEIGNGIRVSETLLTSDPSISALGDCASFPDVRTGRHVRLESVQAATDHAHHIAKRIAKGIDTPYRAVPWFWSDQADWKLQIAGLAGPEDGATELDDGTILRLDGEVVSAVETVNAAKIHMKTRKRMAGDEPVTQAEILAIAG